MRREERVTVQGPVKEQRPDGMSHRGRGGHQQGDPQKNLEGRFSLCVVVTCFVYLLGRILCGLSFHAPMACRSVCGED